VNLIQIFKPGKHTAMSGVVLDFTESDLKATATAYDPALHEAPLVVGHPKVDAPAYGWVKSLAYSGTLDAGPDQVDPEFAEMVNNGRFKKISASFFAPTAPGNPKPGVYYLRHVGFLGATPPSVKGLKNASFADSEEGVIEFSEDVDAGVVSRLFRSLRELVIAKFGTDEADRVIPDYMIESIKPAQPSGPMYADPHQENQTMTAEQIKKLQDDNAALLAQIDANKKKDVEFAERETKIKEQESRAKRTDVVAFADGLVKAGKLLPLDQAPLVEFMAALDAESVIEFAESKDGATRKTRSTIWLREFLARLPKQVDYAEHTKPGSAAEKTASFAAPSGFSVDPVQLDLHARALAHQRANPSVSYEGAVAAVAG